MARVDVTLNNRTYAVACADGQEPRVRELGAFVDAKLRELAKGAGGNVSDTHLLALTAILITDQLFDANARFAELEQSRAQVSEDAIADAVESIAARLETLAARVKGA